MLQATAEKQSDPVSMSELLAASEMAIQLVHSLETAKEAPNKLRKLCDKSNAKIR